VGCPLDLHDPLPHDALLFLRKLQGEGKREEIKVVWGWDLNSRKLTIARTQGKFEILRKEVQLFLDKVHAPTAILKSSFGRLENAACIMPYMHHFMGRIRKVNNQCVANNKSGTKLSCTLCDDFARMHHFL
jgi:hypothetical protein